MECFVDAFAPNSRDDCGNSSAIRVAGEARIFSPLLAGAFRAVSIAYCGQNLRSLRSQDVVIQGYKNYAQTLRDLQLALLDPEQSRSEGVLATVILLMAYEVSFPPSNLYEFFLT